MSRQSYGEDFYKERDSTTRASANAVVPIVLELVQPTSVIDVGCGVGTWLSVFREHGIEDIQGLEGDWVKEEMLQIPVERFQRMDLENPDTMGRRFDLVVCLEVAEHLQADSAERFVEFLSGLGPIVLFSAAIPHQGNTNHFNEQWPDYWAKLFAAHEYEVIDCVRDKIWSNGDVLWWYKQNILIYCARSSLEANPQLSEALDPSRGRPLALVHPEQYLHVHALFQALRSRRYSLFRYAVISPVRRTVRSLSANGSRLLRKLRTGQSR